MKSTVYTFGKVHTLEIQQSLFQSLLTRNYFNIKTTIIIGSISMIKG